MAAFTAAQALEMAMQIEQNGEAFYTAALAKTSDLPIQALFSDLAVAERRHYALFKKMAAEVGTAPIAGDDYAAYVQAALDNALFGGPDKALAIAERATTARLALQAAIGFEKDTLLFFYDLRDLVGEEDRLALTAVIAEEKGHVQRLAHVLG